MKMGNTSAGAAATLAEHEDQQTAIFRTWMEMEKYLLEGSYDKAYECCEAAKLICQLDRLA